MIFNMPFNWCGCSIFVIFKYMEKNWLFELGKQCGCHLTEQQKLVGIPWAAKTKSDAAQNVSSYIVYKAFVHFARLKQPISTDNRRSYSVIQKWQEKARDGSNLMDEC